MTPEAVRWSHLTSVSSGLQAAAARAVLEAADILVLVKGPEVGIFGVGFQGSVPGGIELLVPSPELERARELLSDPV